MDSTTLNNLKTRAAVVRDETKRAANTAQRVGSLLYDLADRFGAELMKDNRELLQYESIDKFPTTGTEGIIYMDTTTGYLYRWDTTSRTYAQVGGNNSTGGTVKHCVVAEGTVSTEDDLLELASAALEGKYYILQATTNAIYHCRYKIIKVGWKARKMYYWDAVANLDALVGDWLTAGWQYYQNGGVAGASTPDEATTYIDDTTGNIYAYNATDGTFSQINNELVELDTTIYVNAVDYSNWLDFISQDLAIYKKEGAYTVVVVSGAKAGQINNNTYNLLVETSTDGSVIRQYLTDRNGYYYRTYQNSKWGAWSNCQYAFKEDIADTNGDTDEIWKYVRWHHAQAKRKHRTTVHYCSSRMKFAMPKVGTTVLIDDAKPHFWGFASFGRPKHGVTKAQLKADFIGNLNLYENVFDIEFIPSKINNKVVLKCSVESRQGIPDWVWNYWQRTDIDGIDTNIYPRVKPYDDLYPHFLVWDNGEADDGVSVDLSNATGSTGLALKSATQFDIHAMENIDKEFITFRATNLASPVVDLCARLTLNDLIAPTPSAHSGNNHHYAIGDIVRFDGTQWQRIDRLATGRSVRVLYQKIEVERTGESAFCYRPQRITLPEFQSFQFQFTSPSQDDARHTVAAPADVLNAYLQYVAKRGGSPAFYQDRHDRTVPRIGTLAIYTKVRTGGSKTGNINATVWHRCLPASGFATGDLFRANYKAKRHHLLCPNTYDNNYYWLKYPWYVDAYIVVVRPVAKFNRTKTTAPNFEPYTQEKPYHRNIEISNRIPVRIAYVRKDTTTTVRVRQFTRS